MSKNRVSSNILFLVTIFYWFSLYAYTSYINPELVKMGVTASFMGFVAGIYGFTQLVLRIPVGIASDKWQNKFFICMGCLCATLAALCMLLFYNPVAFFVGRALGGIAASAWVSFSVLYAGYFSPEQSTKSMTMINMAVQIGRFLSFVLAGIIVAQFGAKAAFVIATVGGVIGFVLSIFIKESEEVDTQPVSVSALLKIASNRTLLVTSVLAIFFQAITFATWFTFTANHAFSIGATPAQLSYINVAILAPSIAVSLLMGKIILKYIKAEWLVIIGLMFTALYCAFLPFTETIRQLYMLQILAGVANTFVFSLLMGLCVRDILPENRGAAMGFYQAMYSIGMVMGPIIMGVITDYFSLQMGFHFMSGLSVMLIIAAAIFLTGKKTEQS